MQFPESWLREFCDPPISSAELCTLLTMAGLEVEEARPVAPPFRGVVVGQVLEVARHPNADRLHVCVVDIGGSSPLAIVCGAANVQAGIKVPVAMVGAELPPSELGATAAWTIQAGQLRGVESHGMLCSARELGLAEDASGLWVLPEDAVIGRNLREQLQLDDTLITLKLTPNLGHCLSVYGVAREVAALTGAPLRTPPFAAVPSTTAQAVAVEIAAPDLCGRFAGRVISGVNPRAASPAWLVDRLARCGQRSVSPLVDISNYVMFEFGQPSHIFDLDKIEGALQVRWARAGETLTLLNGNTVTLDPSVGVIADERGVESLAGIMGGAATAVSDTTTNIYVEAAFWWPEAVAGRSRRFNFTTEASHRFERGVDPAAAAAQLEHITQLVLDICGTEATRCGPVVDQMLAWPDREPVQLRIDRVARVTGAEWTQAECERVMQRLKLPFVSTAGSITVTPPSWRFDLKIEEDLIEEVTRLIGYDALPLAPPIGTLTPRVPSESQRSADDIREHMVRLGYHETINFSFVDARWEQELAGTANPIRVLNPIVSSLSVMRSSLIGSLINALRLNLARKATQLQLFELGRVFWRDETALATLKDVAGVRQPWRLAGLRYGSTRPLQWGEKERVVDFFDVKGDVEALFAPASPRWMASAHPALHPGRYAQIEVGGAVVGFVGELHPRWRQAYELPLSPIVFELDLAALQTRRLPVFAPLPRQQSVWRDLAFIASDRVSHDAVMAAVAAASSGLIRSVRLFDLYKPTAASAEIAVGEHGMALRLELLDEAVTLTDERIDAAVAAVVDQLRERLGLRLRH